MSHPYPLFGSQDLHDDDGPVLDSLVPDSHEPADIKGAVAPIERQGPINLPKASRIYSATQIFSITSNTTDIRQILAEDKNRKTCRIRCFYMTNIGLSLLVADERTKLANLNNWASVADIGSSGQIITAPALASSAAPTDIVLDGHTGAVWIAGLRTLTSQTQPFDMAVVAWGVTDRNL